MISGKSPREPTEDEMPQKQSSLIDKSCMTCNVVFKIKPYHHHRKYCCSACAYKSKDRIKHAKPKDRGCSHCKECGAIFNVTRSSGLGLFCSQSCAARFTGKQTIHAIRKKSMFSSGNAEWFSIGGLTFYTRSSWERAYARFLNSLKCFKFIPNWSYEPKTFEFPVNEFGIRFYTPDFFIELNNGATEYVEVKGWVTEASKQKEILMKRFYPDVKIKTVGRDWFSTNKQWADE